MAGRARATRRRRGRDVGRSVLRGRRALLQRLGWERDSVTGLIFVTQSPDYFLPSTSCMLHQWLGLERSLRSLRHRARLLGLSLRPVHRCRHAPGGRPAAHPDAARRDSEPLRQPRGPCDDAAVQRCRVGHGARRLAGRRRSLLPAHRRQRARRPDHPGRCDFATARPADPRDTCFCRWTAQASSTSRWRACRR